LGGSASQQPAPSELVCYEALVSAMQQRAELAECFRVIEQHRKIQTAGRYRFGETDSASEVCHDWLSQPYIRLRPA